MQTPLGIPDYSQFMQMSAGQRKNLLKMLQFFNGKQMQPLLMVVYEKDPDADVRKLAREMLESQGVQIRLEGDNLPAESQASATPDWMRSSSSPIQNNPSVGIPVTDDLSRRAAESLKKGQGIPQSSTAETASSGQFISESGATVYYTTASGTFESPFSGPDNIDGGEGRVMQRSAAFPQVFLLYPKNLKYIRGEAEKPTNNTSNIWGVVIILVMISVFIFGFSGIGEMFTRQISSAQRFGIDVKSLMSSPMLLFVGIFGLVGVIIVVSSIRNSRRLSRLAQNGQVLIGQATNLYGRWVTTGSGKNRSRSYKVTVNYRVKLPNGRMAEGQDTAARRDLARATLPVPGTPVAVLYVDEQDKMLL